jgi:hypothetical protein
MNKEINFLKLRAAIETEETFNTLKEKYKDIEIDLLSWRDNPSCSCGQRVHEFFNKIYNQNDDSVFLDELFKNEKIQEKIKEISKPRRRIVDGSSSPSQLPPEMTDYRGKVFVVGKSDEDWANFWQKIISDKAAYRSFSLLEKEEYIKVYFL